MQGTAGYYKVCRDSPHRTCETAPELPWARISQFRDFFSEIWATVRCSENSVIFGRHAERSVTDKMSSFHSERLTPDTHIRPSPGRVPFAQEALVSQAFSYRGLQIWVGPFNQKDLPVAHATRTYKQHGEAR